MPYIKIITIFVLTIISIISYMFIQQTKHCIVPKKIELPKIEIPKKSIRFTITKDKNNNIEFTGIFKEAKTPREIAKLLKNSHIEHEIKIDKRLANSDKVITLIKKILNQFDNSYKEWSIVYKDNKLLVDGKCKSEEDKERIENILILSDIDSFSNIRVIPIDEDLSILSKQIISKLNSIVASQKEQISQPIPDKESQKILSNLKSLVPIEKPKKEKIIKKATHIKKKKVIVKKHIHKKIKTKKIAKKTIHKRIKTKKIAKKSICKKIKTKKIKIDSVPSSHNFTKGQIDKTIAKKIIYKEIKNKEIDKDILSLPYVQTVDMNIEEKIKRGEIPPPRTKKPLVKQETIYIPSNEKPIDDNIPWAKLHDINEKVDGIFIPEVINR